MAVDPESKKPLVSRQLRDELFAHELYDLVGTVPALRVFMQSHVFAVWDFMSLLKRLQLEFAPTVVPWRMPRNPSAARFVNEIVLAEESDLDPDGRPASHLDLYLGAMDEIGADTATFRGFHARLEEGLEVRSALEAAGVSACVREFVQTTLQLVQEGSVIEVAAAFLHGREDPIPGMFEQFLSSWDHDRPSISRFAHYLERHIDLDSSAHGPAARQLLERLVGGDAENLRLAISSAERAVGARIQLWSGIEAEIRSLEPAVTASY